MFQRPRPPASELHYENFKRHVRWPVTNGPSKHAADEGAGPQGCFGVGYMSDCAFLMSNVYTRVGVGEFEWYREA
ncbi:hypothetical protein EVAR_61172_1 [Eumeta japonica]|uniref:Uncharacterized protein n=1 Tax=Eumeta variegata TaxID=151549 RepID=A0A4C1ZRX0_EUMVA|nr:hypothetical protein EVAR_61172_1 [Eumeta japonica]